MPDPKDTSKTQRLKKILWESNLNAPVRGVYNLMNTPYEDLMGSDKEKVRRAAESSFDAASGVTIGSAAAPKPRGAITAGYAGKPSKGGLKNIKSTADKNAKRREAAAAKKEARSKEKFGPLVKRQENVPAVREVGRRDLVVTRGQKRDVQPYKEGSKAVAKRGSDSRALTVARENKGNLATTGTRTFGDKGAGKGAGMSTTAKRMLAAAAVGGAGYGLYKGADKPKADQGGTSSNASAKTDRESKAAAFKAKQQGMKTSGSPTAPKKAGDKSRVAKKAPAREKPMSNFERMKQRQYEKEGFGGRSMTSRGAKERVKKERGFKFRDLFKKR